MFDDFALVGDSADYSARAIVTTPLFGFYRPVAFLVTKGHGAVAQWNAPWSYAAVSILLHCVNALLVRACSQGLGLQPAQAGLAALVFLLSPWASETYFWVSARFDLLATLGVLTTLMIVLWGASGSSRAKLATAAVLTFAGTAFAVFSKESAVIAPALVAGTWCAARSKRAHLWWRGLLLVGSSALAVAAYLLGGSRSRHRFTAHTVLFQICSRALLSARTYGYTCVHWFIYRSQRSALARL